MGKDSRDGSMPRKKNGCAGGCFLLSFLPCGCCLFPAARGKAAPMLTFRELKNMADIPPKGQKTPTVRAARQSGSLIAEREMGGDAGIAAYQSGYAVYYAGGAATVFRIHDCGGYCYDSGSRPCGIGSREFDREAWYLRLVLEGEDRLSRNLASKEHAWKVSYSGVSEEWGAMGSGGESVLDRIVSRETVESLLSVLTERQKRAAVLFYLEQKTKRQVAAELGITAPAVSKILAKAAVLMRASLCGHE